MPARSTNSSTKKRGVHARLAEQYIQGVLSGKIPACHWVHRAAQRHVDDCAKSEKDPRYPYEFVEDDGGKVCRFIEHFPHTKGKWGATSERLQLEPWQCFIVVVLFGWLRRSSGKRRFRAAYLEIPRKNGKSLLAAAIGLYMLLADGEFGAEVYSGATSEKQAHEVWRPAKLMLERAPLVTKTLGAEICARSLLVSRTGSKFQPVIGNPGDGPSPSCAIVDEYHEHTTPVLHDSMETGMGAREQPLMFIITTAGYNVAGPCHEKHDECCKVLEGVVESDELFACIWSIDEKDDWADPKSLIKANPNYGVSVDYEFLQSQQRQAMANPLQQNKFKTKHLNVWTSVLVGMFNMQQWALAADRFLDEEELIGEPCWIGLDLASKSDLCTEQRLYRRMWNGAAHYYLFGRYWLPEKAIEEPGHNHAHYTKWVRQGLLTQTDGATVDFDQITEEVAESCARVNPLEVVYDPFNATQMAQALQGRKILTVEFEQRPQNFALPLDELQAALKDGRFHHDGNEMTTWCMSNVVARPTKKGLFAPSKQKGKDYQKIDGAIALTMAIARATAAPKPEPAYQMMFVGDGP